MSPASPAVARVDRVSPAAAGAHTAIDHVDLALDLPGTWVEHPIDDGYDLRRGKEQVIVGFFPVYHNDASGSIASLAESQRGALPKLCKRDAVVRPPRAAAPGQPIWTYATCADPAVAFVFVAIAAQGKVISYEHYRYEAAALTPELERADASIVASLRVKPAAACPSSIQRSAQDSSAQGGACLEAAVLGDEAVAACGRDLEARGWVRDDSTASLIGGQSGKQLVCYARP